jgi:hypothetical protein
MSDNGFCECDETWVRGKRIPRPEFPGGRHDCEYVRRRNSLIGSAKVIADEQCAATGEDGNASDQWTRIFAREMDRLSAERAKTGK